MLNYPLPITHYLVPNAQCPMPHAHSQDVYLKTALPIPGNDC
ncbi:MULTISPECIES: hypothetical protein [unclassified Tolypothrix]|nr:MULTISPECIES: hypothetical protein [unclassified Tolypothrix]EKE97212.1 hypothetical protein FDUTEX481_05298 [Tolypothrix sp. PCC 7601]